MSKPNNWAAYKTLSDLRDGGEWVSLQQKDADRLLDARGVQEARARFDRQGTTKEVRGYVPIPNGWRRPCTLRFQRSGWQKTYYQAEVDPAQAPAA